MTSDPLFMNSEKSVGKGILQGQNCSTCKDAKMGHVVAPLLAKKASFRSSPTIGATPIFNDSPWQLPVAKSIDRSFLTAHLKVA